ncbi:MAG: flagellar assembly protein FliW [Sideroxyarcus sp.]|nr:flagellar assembly protein FliW [Sideroxyarcus sp.]
MIKFTLKRLGGATVEFEADSVIEFPAGLPGFEACKRFKLFYDEGKKNLLFMQSLDDADVLFSLGDPALLNLSYEVILSDDEQKLLASEPGDELLLLVIVYKDGKAGASPDFAKVNSLGPIILNTTKRRGMQKVLKEIDTHLAIKGS